VVRATRACCLAGSLAWANDQAGSTGFIPTHAGLTRPSPKKKSGPGQALDPIGPNCVC